MATRGGRMPYDAGGALAGPARTLYADVSVAVPGDLWDIVPATADSNGEYPAKTGWNDFGLAADAPSYSHNKETAGLEYQQSRGALFETVSTITRQATVQMGQILPENVKIMENANRVVGAIAAPAGESAFQKVPFGIYDELKVYRIAFISYRPAGSAVVTEPGVPARTRPPAVALILPLASLAAEESSFDFDAGAPVNGPVVFTAFPEQTLPAGEEHGFWLFEEPGTIVAP
jgi:hypothetical protein